MRFGFHISIAGGFSKVVGRALKKQCQAMQFFSRNPRGWAYHELNSDDVTGFRETLKGTDINPVFVHMPYLPNLASCNTALYEKSIQSLCEDLKRAEFLRAPYLIVHVGHRGESPEEHALEKISQGINRAFETVTNTVCLLLENTAGQGTEVGYSFNQLKQVITGVSEKHRMGICLDVAHAFAAGYDVTAEKGLEATLHEFSNLIGMERLHLLHLNDSKAPRGSRTDRHWHIGEGFIGRAGFRRIINHPALTSIPGIMETPRKTDKEDLKNMQVIRSLVRE